MDRPAILPEFIDQVAGVFTASEPTTRRYGTWYSGNISPPANFHLNAAVREEESRSISHSGILDGGTQTPKGRIAQKPETLSISGGLRQKLKRQRDRLYGRWET
jgi:hypothetical protein